MATAGQIIRAADFPDAQMDTQDTSGTTTSVGYTAALTGGVTCTAVFVAPTSGRVQIAYGSQISNSGANNTFCSAEVRTGGVVGSGTVVSAAGDATALINASTSLVRFGGVLTLSGLTAGSTYNVQLMYRVSAGTGTYLRKHLAVTPLS